LTLIGVIIIFVYNPDNLAMNTLNANQKKGISSPYLSTGNGSIINELSKVVPSESNALGIPSISLPKDGGLLKDIDKNLKSMLQMAQQASLYLSKPLPD